MGWVCFAIIYVSELEVKRRQLLEHLNNEKCKEFSAACPSKSDNDITASYRYCDASHRQ